jgi:hypothetical protein
LVGLGSTRAFFKPLSENDNSKNQVYLGGSFQILQQIPFGDITVTPDNKNPNYKASLNLWWINEDLRYTPAPTAQLILYARYPEVRLSGFLMNCPTAPRAYMQAIRPEDRKNNNEKDGRVLILGICPDNKVYGYLAPRNSSLATSILSELFDLSSGKTIQDFPLAGSPNANKTALITRLKDIIQSGWHESVRMYPDGSKRPYLAQNGGGYTLEALFDIIPNGKAEPDYKGWELKSFTKTRITLMTPEPDKGFYNEVGAKAFTLKYGHDAPGVIRYFTGTHKVDIKNATSNLTLTIKGYDKTRMVISDVEGGLYLLGNHKEPVAIWSFSSLITHWSRKHSHACYVKYDAESKNGKNGYIYHSPVHLGEKTDLPLFLESMQNGLVVYDPATKVVQNSNGNTSVKARSQFRINFNNLGTLYEKFYEQDVTV